MRDRAYRVWLRNLRGEERYVDVLAWGELDALRTTSRATKQRGEWIDRWQPLVVLAGSRPPGWRFRLRLRLRRWRRRPIRP